MVYIHIILLRDSEGLSGCRPEARRNPFNLFLDDLSGGLS